MALEVNPFLPIGSHSSIHWLFDFPLQSSLPALPFTTTPHLSDIFSYTYPLRLLPER